MKGNNMKAYTLILCCNDFYSVPEPVKYSFSKEKLEAEAKRLNDRVAEYDKVVDANPDEYAGDEWEDVSGLDYAEVKEITIED
jgi:hypothetical protein